MIFRVQEVVKVWCRAVLHCEKESTRVFDFGIEVRTDGIEVRDSSSQECMNLGNLKVRFISYFNTIFSFLYTNCWYSERVIDYFIYAYDVLQFQYQ